MRNKKEDEVKESVSEKRRGVSVSSVLAAIGSEIMSISLCNISGFSDDSKRRLAEAMADVYLKNMELQFAMGYTKEDIEEILKDTVEKRRYDGEQQQD